MTLAERIELAVDGWGIEDRQELRTIAAEVREVEATLQRLKAKREAELSRRAYSVDFDRPHGSTHLCR